MTLSSDTAFRRQITRLKARKFLSRQIIGHLAFWAGCGFLLVQEFFSGVSNLNPLEEATWFLLAPMIVGTACSLPAGIVLLGCAAAMKGRPPLLRMVMECMICVGTAAVWWMVLQFLLRQLGPVIHGLDPLWAISFAGLLLWGHHHVLRRFWTWAGGRRAARRQERAILLGRHRVAQGGQLDPAASRWLGHRIKVEQDEGHNRPAQTGRALEMLKKSLVEKQALEKITLKWTFAKTDTFPTDFLSIPAILDAAVEFIVDYGIEHDTGSILVGVSHSNKPRPCLEICTNIPGGDVWFVLPEHSPAAISKKRLLDTIGIHSGSGILFESSKTADGYLLLRFTSAAHPLPVTKAWQEVEEYLGSGTLPITKNEQDGDTLRVYSRGKRLYVVELSGHSTPKNLGEAYLGLQESQNLAEPPVNPTLRKQTGFSIMEWDPGEGQPIDLFLAGEGAKGNSWFRCIADLSNLVREFQSQGIFIHDLQPENLHVTPVGEIRVYRSAKMKAQQPGSENAAAVQDIDNLIHDLGLTDKYKDTLDTLRKAWETAAVSKANSPSQKIAYYQWQFGDNTFAGEREWSHRWNMILPAVRDLVPGAHILDLGCNAGILDAYFQLNGAAHVTGVDLDEEVLEAARLFAQAAGVKDDFRQGDLNDKTFTDSLLEQDRYDLIVAQSVLHWVQDKEALIRLMARSGVLLYEGHNPVYQEIEFLQDLGFGQVDLLGYTERLRGLFLARREQNSQQ